MNQGDVISINNEKSRGKMVPDLVGSMITLRTKALTKSLAIFSTSIYFPYRLDPSMGLIQLQQVLYAGGDIEKKKIRTTLPCIPSQEQTFPRI